MRWLTLAVVVLLALALCFEHRELDRVSTRVALLEARAADTDALAAIRREACRRQVDEPLDYNIYQFVFGRPTSLR